MLLSILIGVQAKDRKKARWFEVDFKEVTQRKAAIIAANAPLHEELGPGAKESIHPGNFDAVHWCIAASVLLWSLWSLHSDAAKHLCSFTDHLTLPFPFMSRRGQDSDGSSYRAAS